MRLGVIFPIILAIIASAYFSAKTTLKSSIDLKELRLQMSRKQLEKTFGAPHSRDRNILTYIMTDSSKLYITLRDNRVTSAIVRYHRPLKIQDPQMRKLTLVQMNPGSIQDSNPSWFFAGKPAEGLIYKITQNGDVESLTWVPPFSYGNNQPKNLQALLRDFKNQYLSNL